jgi:hypothetical protein
LMKQLRKRRKTLMTAFQTHLRVSKMI